MWDRISENLGDFAENYLWGVGETESDRKEFFKKKYGIEQTILIDKDGKSLVKKDMIFILMNN